MKKIFKVILVLVVALTSTTQLVNAQKIPFLMYGVSAGVNTSTFTLKNTDLSKTSQLGYQVGGMVGIDLPLLEVSAEALWIHNKMKFSDFSDTDITSNSIEVPILASVPVFGPLRVKAGPSFVVYNKAKQNFADGSIPLDAVKSSVGYVLGLGLNFYKFTFDVRYNGQFSDKKKVLGIENVTSRYAIKSTSYSASVGYRF